MRDKNVGEVWFIVKTFFARKEAGSHLHTQLLVYIFAEPLSDVPQFLLQAFMRRSQLFGMGSSMEVAKDHVVGSCARGGRACVPDVSRSHLRPVSRAPFDGVSRMCPRRVRTVFLMIRCILACVRMCPVMLGCCVPDVSSDVSGICVRTLLFSCLFYFVLISAGVCFCSFLNFCFAQISVCESLQKSFCAAAV